MSCNNSHIIITKLDQLNSAIMSTKWNKIILLFVILALLHLILDTTPSISSDYKSLLFALDGIITLIFIIDFYINFKKTLVAFKQSKSIKELFRVSLIIDFLSIIPFFVAFLFPGLKAIGVLRLLRLLRIFKLINLIKSHSLIINAIKNKRHELSISMQVVLVLTIILSAVLFFVENPSQPENFSSIIDAFLWSISKFIGEIGGFGDFAPVTVAGKILATFVGILGIALFAVPAGIIASGFVEEIELVKRNSELDELYSTLIKAFHFDILAGQRAKEQIGLKDARRRFITLKDASIQLKTSETNLFDVCALERNIKLSKRLKPSGDEEVLLEYFENNSTYGTFINRNSNITIVSPHSNDGFNLGHYSYSLAELLGANYISVEKYGIYSFVEENNINFTNNDAFIREEEFIENEIIKSFIQDLKNVVQQGSYVFNIGSSMGNSPSFHILTGGKLGEMGVCVNGTFGEIAKVEKLLEMLKESEKSCGFTTTTHSHYGTDSENHLDRFAKNNLHANAMTIKINVELMKGTHENYYKSLGILGESIKHIC